MDGRKSLMTAGVLYGLALLPWEVLAKITLAFAFAAFFLLPDPMVRIGAVMTCMVVMGLNKIKRDNPTPVSHAD